jgi:anaerobic magnesium-protoporphyrin IX monomethyl ester cyclase
MLRTMLVTPNWRWDDSPLAVDTLLPPVCPPLEYAYMASGLEGDHRILDAYAAALSVPETATAIREFDPDYIVVTSTPSLLYWRCPPMTVEAPRFAIQAAKASSQAKVIAIGPHPTFSPAWFTSKTGADFCFRGAFERELPRLLATSGLDTSSHFWRPLMHSSIKVETASSLPRASFRNFDFSLPYEPHMWCIDQQEKSVAGTLQKGAILEASRGCPWTCSYCAKGPVRDRFDRRATELVLAELDELKGCGIDYVFFIDETFNLKGEEFDSLLEGLRRSGIRFGFQGRADLVTTEVAQRLRDAGCVYCELGIDILSDELSQEIGRRQRLDRTLQGLRACRQFIPIVRFNRLNLSTLDYKTRLGFRSADEWPYPADPAYPYPGSPLGDRLMRLYGMREFDWEFAQKYSWWLRIEVYLQRRAPSVPDEVISELQSHFLDLSPEAARFIARRLENVKLEPEFHKANKYVQA